MCVCALDTRRIIYRYVLGSGLPFTHVYAVILLHNNHGYDYDTMHDESRVTKTARRGITGMD